MTPEATSLAFAALDPNQGAEAATIVSGEIEQHQPDEPLVELGLTLAVTVEPPAPYKRWRFFVFWCLIRLAAWAYPFKFEIYRTPRPWEES